ncbi:MAG: hypothetical protein FJ091_09165 [Deltaproteobacteria bacterium]|nr:hypothetical protein [Deltaproteobacteria bacterium]
MRWTKAVSLIVLIACGRALAQSVPFPTPAGDGSLSGSAVVRVKGCGRATIPFGASFALESDGTWSLDAPVAIGGASRSRLTWGAFYTRLRVKTLLAPSSASLAALGLDAEARASALCREPVVLAPLALRKGTLKLNKRWTLARLRLSLRASASAASATRGVRVRWDATGPWIPEED